MKALLVALATLAVLLGTAPAAGAAEDAGTLSPLAAGGGNRALAMGGAFTSIADDASAPVWNPAGLGFLARRELQGSRATLYGLEVTEEYASFAWPSWRWGAAALTARRVGVDEIERRDDRNLLLGTFASSEMEVDFAWGHAVGEKWSVGAGAKLARQEMGELSGNGLGLDVGVLGRPFLGVGGDESWAGRLALGLAVRNAVAPTIRLDRESVTEPTELRGGISYRQPFLGDGAVLVAVDATGARDVDPKVRGGLEISPHPLLALRGGWDGDDFTAGAGICWHSVSFDYAYEDNALDGVHRFGATMQFGPSVAEARLAAHRAEDEAFRERLAATFREQEEQRLRELLSRGAARLGDGRLEEALDAAASARALAPDDGRAKRLEARCLSAQAELHEAKGELTDAVLLYGRSLALVPDDAVAASLARCRAAGDQRAARSARIRDLFSQALDAFGSGDLAGARERLRAILQLAPEDADARTMQARTDAAIVARVAELVARARDDVAHGLLDDAETRLTEARALDEKADGIATVTAQAHRAERDLQTAARAKTAPAESGGVAAPASVDVVAKAPALSKKREREVADLYRRGVEAIGAERPEEAVRYWELVWLADPEYENVAEYLKREYLLRGLDSFSHGRFDEAISVWEKARDVDPTDQRTLGYLSRAREQLARSREILGGTR
ncbi:MAG: PorV/PorQ family protein [bacterium]